MAKRQKKNAGRPPWALPVLAIIILGGIWGMDQVSRLQAAPGWLHSIFTTPPALDAPQVGLVAGHSGNDSGAVCPDGLTEAPVNLDVTTRAAQVLRRQGIQVDILEEFDDRLRGYQGAAFVSIHSDSCEVDYSGFKVASQETAGEESVRLTECLWQEYEAATQLPRHPDTITPDMTRYHAFNRIAVDTPAAIIELGFLRADGPFLTGHADRAAAGVANGILCFLNPTSTPQP